LPSIINASNSGFGGIVSTGDSSGVLELQTTGTTAVTIDTSQRVGFVAGTAAAPAITRTGDTNTGIWFPAADTIAFAEGGTEVMRIDSSGNVGIGTASPSAKLSVTAGSSNLDLGLLATVSSKIEQTTGDLRVRVSSSNSDNYLESNRNIIFGTGASYTERMRITSTGTLLVAKTSATIATVGFQTDATGQTDVTVSGSECMNINRNTNDGDLVRFRQDNNVEGSISVSGTTVSYNGGHLSRWSQFDNETTQVAVYRGTVLESVNAMCVWEKDGEPLPNEQATKTIVSTTLASKAVAGVFDMYDVDDEDNPYDFYVAQSGDFVIRIAQGVTVQNGDLLESAGDGTAKPQADDICRSSTVAKVTSNYVSATYEDGSYCVPCILMIG
jgi:hypothetical protein